jgi:hypothetical protein
LEIKKLLIMKKKWRIIIRDENGIKIRRFCMGNRFKSGTNYIECFTHSYCVCNSKSCYSKIKCGKSYFVQVVPKQNVKNMLEKLEMLYITCVVGNRILGRRQVVMDEGDQSDIDV